MGLFSRRRSHRPGPTSLPSRSQLRSADGLAFQAAATAMAQSKCDVSKIVDDKVPAKSLQSGPSLLYQPGANHLRPRDTFKPASAQMLESLLSKLPVEIRLTIYELCIPCMWHRKCKILIDYISDCRWMATSPMVFSDAAPLILNKPVPYIYTRLDEGETISGVFEKHMQKAFPGDCGWVLPMARELIEKLAVSIRCPLFYKSGFLEDGLPKFFNDIIQFKNLERLYLSLGPETLIPSLHGLENDDNFDRTTGNGVRLPAAIAVLDLKKVIPRNCEVTWRLDRAAMPEVADPLKDKKDLVVSSLEEFHADVGRVWALRSEPRKEN